MSDILKPEAGFTSATHSVNANADRRLRDMGDGTHAEVMVAASGADEYETVAASQTDQVLGATGAAGDFLSHLIIVPAAAASGAVSIKDGGGSAISIFAGGGTTALPTLAPITVYIGMTSAAGAWKVTTGADVSVIAVGDFT